MMKKIWMILFTLYGIELNAREIRNLGRSPRALLMGNAFTSLATDEYTLFYNPALLARHENFSFTPLNLQFSVTNALADSDRFSNIPDTPTGFADVAFNYPVHLGFNYSPGFKMGKFGLTAIVDQQTNFNLVNNTTPMIDIDYRNDRGFIMGYGMVLDGNYSPKSGGTQSSFGLSFKYLQRESIYGLYHLNSTSFLDALGAGEIDQVLNGLGRVQGQGWGIDLGYDYITSSGNSSFMFSFAILDPYTILRTNDNPQDREVQTQPMQVNLGTAWELKFGPVAALSISADYINIYRQFEGNDTLRRLRLGVDFGTPVLKVLAGYNAGYYSYGAQVNLGLIDVFAGFYDVDIGQDFQQQRSRRALIYLSLFDFTFDP